MQTILIEVVMLVLSSILTGYSAKKFGGGTTTYLGFFVCGVSVGALLSMLAALPR